MAIRIEQDGLWGKVIEGKYSRGALTKESLEYKVAHSHLWKALAQIWPNLAKEEFLGYQGWKGYQRLT